MEQILPGLAAGLCFLLCWSMLRRYARRRRPHEVVWGATFGAFGLAAGVEAYASAFGWTPALARLYYLAGASLSVGFLAVGTLFLLIPRPIALTALAIAMIQGTFMVFLVGRAPIDPVLIQDTGWAALTRDGNLRALALTINVLGTLIVVIGTFGSAYAQWVNGVGSRAGGILLIGVGTLVVATGGSLTRYGHHWLYGPMVLGMLLIYAGYRRATASAASPAITASARIEAGTPEAPPADDTIPSEDAGREAWRQHTTR